VWAWTAAVLALLLVAVLLWQGSDARATSSTTAAAPAPAEGLPGDRLALSWSADLDPAPRRVVHGGQVLVPGPDGVALHDPATGREAWHHTRANARLCDATAVDDLVIAVFRTAERCDEAVALHAATGVRAWYRNVDFRGDLQLASTESIVLASAPTGIATLDPTGNSTRWRYAPPAGCRLTGADVGSTGVVVLQRCEDVPTLQVKLFDGFGGEPTWTRDVDTAGVPARLTGADRLVGLAVADRLQVLSPVDGTLLQDLPLGPAGGQAPTREPLLQVGVADVALVWARGTVSALDEVTGAPRWQLPARGLPAGTGPGREDAVLVPEEGAFVLRSLDSGEELGRSAVDVDPAVGGRTAVVGPVVVSSTANAVAAYR
jgi:outer membrane protein assembly factor BamB